MKKVLDPHADLREYENEARVGGNVASLQRYRGRAHAPGAA